MSNPGEMGGFVGRKTGEKSNFSVTCSLLSQYLKEKGSFGDLGLGMACSFDGKGKPEASCPSNLLPAPCDLAKRGRPALLPDLNATKPSDGFTHHHHLGEAVPIGAAPKKPQQQALQMTIFYGGKVLVFDNFPAEKVTEVMAIAGKVDNNTASPQNPVNVPDRLSCPPPRSTMPASTSGNNLTPVTVPATAATTATAAQDQPPRPHHLQIASDLPIARRVSLNRFLEKRKGRISSKAPYQVDGSPDIGSSSSGGSASGKPEETASLPSFSKPEATKPFFDNREDISNRPVFTTPETTFPTPVISKLEETTPTLASRKPEEKKPWLRLATPSTSDMSEFELR